MMLMRGCNVPMSLILRKGHGSTNLTLLSYSLDNKSLDIRPVLWLLVGKKGVCSLLPLTTVDKDDEEIRLVVFPFNGYTILKVWCRYLGLPMKDGGRMTFLPGLISSELLAAVKPTQITMRKISCP